MHTATGRIHELETNDAAPPDESIALSGLQAAQLRNVSRSERLRLLRTGGIKGATKQQAGRAKMSERLRKRKEINRKVRAARRKNRG